MPSPFPWQTSVQYLKGVGPKRAFFLGKLNIQTLEDLLYFIPFRYEDRAKIKKISQVESGKIETIVGEVMAVSLSETARRRLKIVEIAVSDQSGVIKAKWFNQQFLKTYFKRGDRIMLSGPVKMNYYGGRSLEMESPVYERVGAHDTQLHMDRIVPVYHETKGLTSKQIRILMKQVLDQFGHQIPELLPLEMIQKYQMPSLSEAIMKVHFPEKEMALNLLNAGRSPAHQRLIFDELFILQTGLALRKKGVSDRRPGIQFHIQESTLTPFRALLPFALTRAQEKVFLEIKKDMSQGDVMNRLIQGDVGSGKTLVALMSILIALENQYQTALMAPTEILAEQHFFYLKPYLETLGKSILLITSDMRKKEKEEVITRIREGQCDLVVGTHALIQKGVLFKKLGLAVVDEQHKFGVLQRATLAEKGRQPDLLIMTATPIPRTLGLTLYGDLNISVIDELPPGRMPVRTRLYYGKQRQQAYGFIREEIKKGHQAFVVCPLVDESEKMDLKAAIALLSEFKEQIFPEFNIGLLHGKMTREEKESVMLSFKSGKMDILVATTVVEVGIDIPNATVMAIEHAERFGLSQLHQLRGRVGRGRVQSYCLMIAEYPISNEGKRRLNAMLSTTDGFKISEEDLAIRGPGEFFGTQQSGLPVLRIANLIRDADLLDSARDAAFEWVARHPALDDNESKMVRAFLERKWGGKLEWLSRG